MAAARVQARDLGCAVRLHCATEWMDGVRVRVRVGSVVDDAALRTGRQFLPKSPACVPLFFQPQQRNPKCPEQYRALPSGGIYQLRGPAVLFVYQLCRTGALLLLWGLGSASSYLTAGSTTFI
jgi:hypothetical protein